MSQPAENQLMLTLHGDCTHSTHWAYSAAPRIRALRSAIHLLLPGLMNLRVAETTPMCGNLLEKAILDKSPNCPASPASRLVIEATYLL